jgi:hypothetical protein
MRRGKGKVEEMRMISRGASRRRDGWRNGKGGDETKDVQDLHVELLDSISPGKGFTTDIETCPDLCAKCRTVSD